MDYIEFDELGIKEIRCMQCKQIVAQRRDRVVPHPTIPGREILSTVLIKWSNWRQIRVDLSDSSYAEPIVCADCVARDEFSDDELIKQMKIGWSKEFDHNKRSNVSKAIHAAKVEDLEITKHVKAIKGVE